eukprot:355557-Chlamydomonas_euryale.AAC.6
MDASAGHRSNHVVHKPCGAVACVMPRLAAVPTICISNLAWTEGKANALLYAQLFCWKGLALGWVLSKSSLKREGHGGVCGSSPALLALAAPLRKSGSAANMLSSPKIAP